MTSLRGVVVAASTPQPTADDFGHADLVAFGFGGQLVKPAGRQRQRDRATVVVGIDTSTAAGTFHGDGVSRRLDVVIGELAGRPVPVAGPGRGNKPGAGPKSWAVASPSAKVYEIHLSLVCWTWSVTGVPTKKTVGTSNGFSDLDRKELFVFRLMAAHA